jgi:predicted secreted protein
MKHLRSFVSGILVLAFSSAAFGGNYAQIKFIGFSLDGRYLAYEETGTESVLMHDVTTYYVDTAKNSFASPYTMLLGVEGRNGHPDFRHGEVSYKNNVAAKLRKLRIERGNTGQFVVAHFLNDLSFIDPVEHSASFFENGYLKPPVKKMMPNYAGGFYRGETTESERIIFNDFINMYSPDTANSANTDEFFELTLTPSLAEATGSCAEFYKFELTLKDNTGRVPTKLQILQKDGEILPDGLVCAAGYKIEQVYIYRNRIAVFLNVFSKGYEGPNMQYKVVTGVIAGR